MKKHFELTTETKIISGVTLFRIKATITIEGIVKKGEFGGWVEKEKNLNGNAWVSGNARVYGNARVSGNACVYGNAWVEETKDYLCIGPVGSNRFITITKSNKIISAGCFVGNIKDFSKAVKNKYGKGSDYDFVISAIESYLK